MKTWEKKLLQWQQAGLISKEQENKIKEHESFIPSSTWVLSAIFLLGAFVIGIGVISSIAANWQQISVTTKLALDFALLLALAFLTFKSKNRKALHFDALLALFLLLCLGSIGLIAQIYQTGGSLSQALIFWLVITFPAILHARKASISSVWLFMLGGTYIFEISLGKWDFYRSALFYTAFVSLPLIFLLCNFCLHKWLRSTILWSMRLNFAVFGLVALVILDSFSLGKFGNALHPMQPAFIFLIGLGIANFIALFFLSKFSRTQKIIAATTLSLFIILITLHFVSGYVPSLVSALLSMGVLVGMGFFHAARREENLFQFYFLLIALRFLILYFQALGGLAATGIGLIFSGLIIIGTAYAWQKNRKHVAERLERWLNA